MKLLRLAPVALALALSLLLPMLAPVGASAAPAREEHGPLITWDRRTLSEPVLPGQSRTFTVTFKSREALSDVALVVRGDARRVISIDPAQPGSVAANAPVTVKITVTMPADRKVPVGGLLVVTVKGKDRAQVLPMLFRTKR